MRCWYCGESIWHAGAFSRDHVVPRSAGGGGGLNLVPCCKNCNGIKGVLTLEEFRRLYGPAHRFYGETVPDSVVFYGVQQVNAGGAEQVITGIGDYGSPTDPLERNVFTVLRMLPLLPL